MQLRMELFRRNSKAFRFVITKHDVFHAYLGYSVVAIQRNLMGTASLIKEMSIKSTSVINSTHCIHKIIYAQLCL
jgi:hypothetical protein